MAKVDLTEAPASPKSEMNSMKIAIKVLSQSDLSFFAVHHDSAKQRAIDLNSQVFIERFYPGLRNASAQVIFPLVLIGPGGKVAHRLTRMAMRSLHAKNWLIKGEPIYHPDEESGHYRKLTEGDFAIMVFEGNGRPQAVTLVLVSATEDAKLHAAMVERFERPANSALFEVSGAAIAHLRVTTLKEYSANEHPLDSLLSRDTVEDVLFGSDSPVSVGSSGHSVAVAPEDLRRQLLAAAETRQQGEELFAAWLTSTGHEEDDFEWISQSHARSVYAHEVYAARWLNGAPHVFVTVKTTRAHFEQPIHMSMAELRFAVRVENYRIARLYNLDGTTPRLRILTGVQPVAARLVERLGSLPDGVTADSLQLDPGLFEVELEAKLPTQLS
jgi:hypothetical protein